MLHFALRLCVSAGILCTTGIAIASADQRPITAEDLWAIHRLGAPAVSPDGRWAMVPVIQFDLDADGGTSDLALLDLETRALRRFTHDDSVDSAPDWSPDSRTIAYISRHGQDNARLSMIPVDGGEARTITELPVSVASPRWFPDGRRIAFIAHVPAGFDGDWEALAQDTGPAANVHVTENRIYRFWDRWLTDGAVPRLFVVDVSSGAITDLMPGHDLVHAARTVPDYDIAPDGRTIAISINTNPPPYESMNQDVLLLATDGSGETRNITADNPADDLAPVFSRNGRYLFYGRRSRTDFYADTVHIVRHDLRDDSHVVLTAGADLSFSGWLPDERGRRVYATAQHRGVTSVFSITVPGGEVSEVHRGGTVSDLRLGPGNTLLFVRSAFSAPPELYMTTRSGRHPRRLTRVNEGVVERIDFGRVENMTFKGANGVDIQMWVVYPPGFDASSGKWPLLVQIHGGPHGIFGDEFHFRWNAQAFAAPGYVVILPNFHGSTSFGQAFAESIHGNHADLPHRDVMKAVDHMLARGYIDADRLAAAGGSYGGYLVSWIAGQTDRFAALINHAGVYNIMAQFASDITRHREAAYGAPPWIDIERMNRYNPAMYADNFVTPMLIYHGERDFRVPVTQGLEVYGIYQGKGVPARLVLYPDEHHWILRPRNSIHWYGEFHDWLGRWLGPGPVP